MKHQIIGSISQTDLQRQLNALAQQGWTVKSVNYDSNLYRSWWAWVESESPE